MTSISRGCASALLVALLGSLLPSSARAQMIGEVMEAAPVDWTSSHTLRMLIIQAIMLPLYITTLPMLYARRRLYPIAGRGATLLLLLNAASLFGSALYGVAHLAYPKGLPCAMLVVGAYVTMPHAAVMMVRAYLLVFRLEIHQYLAELAWRKEQIQRLVERHGEAAHWAASPSKSVSALQLPSLDPASIPGHFCITNRRFMGAKWIMGGLNVAGALLLLSFALTVVYDWDVHFTNKWLESNGFALDPRPNQFVDGAFFNSHRCMPVSFKSLTFYSAMVLAFPFLIFLVWRMRVNARLMEQRAREQAEFEARMRATAGGDGGDAAGDRSGGGTEVPTPIGGDAAHSAGSSTHGSSTASELNELTAVKLEMGLALTVGGLALSCGFLFLRYAYTWLTIEITLTLAGLWGCTVVPALVSSYSVARKQRQVLLRARRDTKGRGRRGKLVALVPHHRPLYRLAHVIADPHAYPVLLKFLQKEYSSENALFYIEARRFARECRAAERALPGWSSSLDDDDDSNTNTTEGGGSVLHSMASGGGGAGISVAPGAAGRAISVMSKGGGGGTLEQRVSPQPGHIVGDEVTELTALVERPGSSTAAMSPTANGCGNGSRYVVRGPLREDKGEDGSSRAGRGGSADEAAGPPLYRVASFCPSETQSASTDRNTRLFSIRVEQPSGGGSGGGGGVSGEDATAPPSLSPSTVVSPQQTRSILPASPSLMPSWSGGSALQSQSGGMWALSSALQIATPGVSRTVSARSSIELLPSPTVVVSPLSSTDSAAVTPFAARDTPVSTSGMQQQQHASAAVSPLPSSPQRSPHLGPGPARTELAWGPVPSAAAAAAPASPGQRSPHHPGAVRRASSSKPSVLQRQQTRLAQKLLAGPFVGAGAANKAAVPKAPPLSFRQMHELASSLRVRCMRLHAEYLRPNSVYQVNVANDLAKMLRAQIAQLEQWQPTPLTEAGEPDYERAAMESAPPPPPPFPLSSLYQQTAMAVFTLMETDSFRRFLLTPDFEQLLQRADDLEMERLERQNALSSDTNAVLAHADAALQLHAHTHSIFSLPGAVAAVGAGPAHASTRSDTGALESVPLVLASQAQS